MPTYLDSNGNPIPAPTKTYLDGNGNPIQRGQDLRAKTVPSPSPSMLQNTGSAIGDFLQGIGKGAMNTLAPVVGGVAYGVQKGAQALGVPANLLGTVPDSAGSAISSVRAQVVPTNTAQKIGYGGEQAAEFLVPGGAEEAGAVKLASFAPKLGKYAAPLARIATSAGGSGLVNKAQGGSFFGGVAMGGVGGAAAEGLKAAAPLIAESALGVRAADRAYGRTPGKAILDETTGINAGNIAKQAQAKVSLYESQLENAARTSPIDVDLDPARLEITNAQSAADARNNPFVIKKLGQLSDQLSTQFGSAAAIPPQVSADKALSLKRGVGDLVSSWNPATPSTFVDRTVGKVYRSLDDGLDLAVPESNELNQKISTLLPVAARAGATDLNAGVAQRLLGRFTKPTGALFSGGVGATEGYHKAGIPGAVAGGLFGMALPELIGSPTAQMMMARSANSALVPPVVKILTGGGLQANRTKSLYGAR